ncbi:hypothetical protein D9M69_386190 [compost metagenome]
MAEESVVTITAVQKVPAVKLSRGNTIVTTELVVTIPAQQDVIATITEQYVVTLASIEHVPAMQPAR